MVVRLFLSFLKFSSSIPYSAIVASWGSAAVVVGLEKTASRRILVTGCVGVGVGVQPHLESVSHPNASAGGRDWDWLENDLKHGPSFMLAPIISVTSVSTTAAEGAGFRLQRKYCVSPPHRDQAPRLIGPRPTPTFRHL
uniref:Uncharacterized protein n=1 Tax=Coccidioides posadasii RMSCC 3488 TaxID=454284 RepID=A0A0J6FAI4_COCPO|nr:hypothetical protein CPAG_03583 [Coccidioides posadasii RMSCC 3488]